MSALTGRITPHFTWIEASCHDGTPVPPQLQPNARRLAMMCERIRSRFGGAIVPVSWYRTPAWNHRVGGAEHSQHLEAHAMDGRPSDVGAIPGLIRCIEDMLRDGELPELGGIGIYPAWVHVDCRQRPEGGHIARWNGEKTGDEQAA